MTKRFEEKHTLYEKLDEYAKSDYYPFHMPGHKRNMGEGTVYSYDITEIDGFDNLHHPEGIIRERLEVVSKYYQSKKSYYLINGSSCGILTAISAVMQGKKKLIMARNCHKSAYNAAFLSKVEVDYLYPKFDEKKGIYGAVEVSQVQELCEQNVGDIGGIIIVSPTYEGVVSNIEKIAEVAHQYQIPLIVDEAHGAHFGMHEYFPKSALRYGADVVIQSLHKTLPALTQTAILHIGKNSLVSTSAIERYLAIFQTSSPSYVLMHSIDKCMDMIMNEKAHFLFENYSYLLENFRTKMKELSYISLWNPNHELEDMEAKNYFDDVEVMNCYDYDKSKLVIIPDENFYNGKELYDILLERYHIQLEMASEKYVIAMTSVMDTTEGFDRLYLALEQLDKEIDMKKNCWEFLDKKRGNLLELPKTVQKAIVCQKISDAYFEKYDIIELEQSAGRISMEFLYLYPPGVPILAPGECITQEIVETVKHYQEQGLSVQGLEDMDVKFIKVKQECANYLKTESEK